MSCKPFERWIDDEASGLLAAPERSRLLTHLEACATCRTRRGWAIDSARLLGRARQAVPVVDVRARVMTAIRLEAEAARARLRVGARAFWAGMAASFTAVCVLAALASRTASALPAEMAPAAGTLARLTVGLCVALRPFAAGLRTLIARTLEAAGHALGSFAFLVPLLEAGAIAILTLAFLSATFPVARALWPAQALRRADGR